MYWKIIFISLIINQPLNENSINPAKSERKDPFTNYRIDYFFSTILSDSPFLCTYFFSSSPSLNQLSLHDLDHTQLFSYPFSREIRSIFKENMTCICSLERNTSFTANERESFIHLDIFCCRKQLGWNNNPEISFSLSLFSDEFRRERERETEISLGQPFGSHHPPSVTFSEHLFAESIYPR